MHFKRTMKTLSLAIAGFIWFFLLPGSSRLAASMGFIEGRVTNDQGTPLSGVWVVPSPSRPDGKLDDSLMNLSVVSGADGSYSINSVPAGGYSLFFAHPDGVFPAHLEGGVLVSGDQVTRVDAVLHSSGSVSGVITNQDGAPLVQVSIVLVKEGMEYLSTLSDENGAYSFASVEPGTYGLKATVPVELTRAVVAPVNVDSGQDSRADVTVATPRTGDLMVVVRNRLTNEIVSPVEKVLIEDENAILRLTPDFLTTEVESVFLGLPSDRSYNIKVAAPGFLEGAETGVTLIPDDLKTIDVLLDPDPFSVSASRAARKVHGPMAHIGKSSHTSGLAQEAFLEAENSDSAADRDKADDKPNPNLDGEKTDLVLKIVNVIFAPLEQDPTSGCVFVRTVTFDVLALWPRYTKTVTNRGGRHTFSTWSTPNPSFLNGADLLTVTWDDDWILKNRSSDVTPALSSADSVSNDRKAITFVGVPEGRRHNGGNLQSLKDDGAADTSKVPANMGFKKTITLTLASPDCKAHPLLIGLTYDHTFDGNVDAFASGLSFSASFPPGVAAGISLTFSDNKRWRKTHDEEFIANKICGIFNKDEGPSTGLRALDAVKPTCERVPATGVLKVKVQDKESGLRSVKVTAADNARHNGQLLKTGDLIPGITQGQKEELIFQVERFDASKPASITFEVKDICCNVTTCDPVVVLAVRDRGKPAQEILRGIPEVEGKLTIYNGSPGLRNLAVDVNGKTFRITGLGDGQERALDLSSAMLPGSQNVVTLTAYGKPGSSATVILHD